VTSSAYPSRECSIESTSLTDDFQLALVKTGFPSRETKFLALLKHGFHSIACIYFVKNFDYLVSMLQP